MIPTANKPAFCVGRSGTKRHAIRQQPTSRASASVTTAVATTKTTTVSLRKVTLTLLTTVQPHTSALQRNSKLFLSNSRDTHRRLLRRLYVTLDFCPVVLHPLRNPNFAWRDPLFYCIHFSAFKRDALVYDCVHLSLYYVEHIMHITRQIHVHASLIAKIIIGWSLSSCVLLIDM